MWRRKQIAATVSGHYLRSRWCLLRGSRAAFVQTQTRANEMGNFYLSAPGEALGTSCVCRWPRGTVLRFQAFWLLREKRSEMPLNEKVGFKLL